MIILIEGKNSKSKVLQQLLKNPQIIDPKSRILMFDKVNCGIKLDNLDVLTHLDMSYDILLEWTKVSSSKYIEHDYVVYEYNVPMYYKNKFMEAIKHINEKEEFKNIKFFLTIQNDNLDMVRVTEFERRVNMLKAGKYYKSESGDIVQILNKSNTKKHGECFTALKAPKKDVLIIPANCQDSYKEISEQEYLRNIR